MSIVPNNQPQEELSGQLLPATSNQKSTTKGTEWER